MALIDLSNNTGVQAGATLPGGQINLGLSGGSQLSIGSTGGGLGANGAGLLDGSFGILPTTNLPTGQIGVGVGSGQVTIGSGGGGAIGDNLLSGMINLLPNLSLPTGPIVVGVGDGGVGIGAGAGNGSGGGTGGGSGGAGGGGAGTGGSGTGTGGGGGSGGVGSGGTGTGGTGGSGGGAGAGGAGAGGTSTGGAGGGPTTVPNTGASLPDVQTAFSNIFRTNGAAVSANLQAQLDQLDGLVQAGTVTKAQAILQLAHAAAPVTGLAVVSYAFFTGKVPTVAGLDYLVNSAANPTDLNDPYYAPFNTENRYINFASNLGLHGEGTGAFIAEYGNLTFNQAVERAFVKIVGLDVATNGGFASAGAVADVQSRKAFFEAVANERFGNDNHDLATKLAAIGYILQEAVRAGVGLYGDATENYLFDLADGSVQGNVDLIGVYGPNSAYNVDLAMAA